MRTTNFKFRNEIVERGAVPKSHKGKKANVERKVVECYQWKASGQCPGGDSCSFRHEQAYGNRGDHCNIATNAIFNMSRRRKSQQEVKERCREKISHLIEGDNTSGLCVLRCLSEKIFSEERREIGIKTRRQVLQGHAAPIFKKKTGKRGSISKN